MRDIAFTQGILYIFTVFIFACDRPGRYVDNFLCDLSPETQKNLYPPSCKMYFFQSVANFYYLIDEQVFA